MPKMKGAIDVEEGRREAYHRSREVAAQVGRCGLGCCDWVGDAGSSPTFNWASQPVCLPHHQSYLGISIIPYTEAHTW